MIDEGSSCGAVRLYVVVATLESLAFHTAIQPTPAAHTCHMDHNSKYDGCLERMTIQYCIEKTYLYSRLAIIYHLIDIKTLASVLARSLLISQSDLLSALA